MYNKTCVYRILADSRDKLQYLLFDQQMAREYHLYCMLAYLLHRFTDMPLRIGDAKR